MKRRGTERRRKGRERRGTRRWGESSQHGTLFLNCLVWEELIDQVSNHVQQGRIAPGVGGAGGAFSRSEGLKLTFAFCPGIIMTPFRTDLNPAKSKEGMIS